MRRAMMFLGLAAALGCGRAPIATSETDRQIVEAEEWLAQTIQTDYTRFAQAFLAERADGATYLAQVRDRSAKRRLAARTRGYAAEVMAADKDRDLVPDDRDRCPLTPADTPTDDAGCPVQVDPAKGPSPEAIRRAESALGILATADCKDAPVPSTPMPHKLGYNNVDRQDIGIAMSPVTNQPAGCPVFYEIDARMARGWVALPPIAYVRTAFRASEATESTANRIVFRVRGTDTGLRKKLYDLWSHYSERSFRVRAFNGNGVASPWSEARPSQVSFGEP